MEFTASREALNQALGRVNRLATLKMPLPILNNILIIIKKDQLTFSTTDLELGIESGLTVETKQEGRFTVPARLLHEFIQATNEARITGKVTDNAVLNLKGDQSDVKIRGLDASEFPNLPFQGGEPLFTIKAADLKLATDFVSYAAAIDDTRPVLAGILFQVQDGLLTLAATDSYRLAERKITLPKKLAEARAVIIPKRTLVELARLLADTPGDISVFVGDNQVEFHVGDVRLLSRLIDGSYPNYQNIIPNEYRTRVTAHLQDFTSALKLSQLFAREAGNVVTLAMVPGKGMTVQAAASQRGEATQQFTAITEGDELTAGFNVKYLLDALGAMQADNVFLEFSGADRPVLVRPANTTEALALVMPLKLE